MASFSHLDPELAINPSAAQVERFLQLDPGKPAVIVNYHEYWPEARYPATYADAALPPDVSGRDAYHRYIDGVLRHVFPQEPGAYLRIAPAELVLVGSGNWHEVVVGHYPTRDAMFRISSNPLYSQFVVHRTAGLKSALTLALARDPFDPAGLLAVMSTLQPTA